MMLFCKRGEIYGGERSVTTDLDLHAELGRGALDHAVSVDPVHGLAVQLTGAADGGAEEGAFGFVSDAHGLVYSSRKASNL
jgi:hypothetical protein